ncbi:hypothetical protein FQN55_009523 [Onygenales sp. PD_40]|nr:hypothetical protein FQN55_009523 [Onygenales sp. PD_40]
MSSNTGEQPRRRFPPEVACLLQPNSEYTRWGDYLFEVYGSRPDGTLAVGDPLTTEQVLRMERLRESKYKGVEFPARFKSSPTDPPRFNWPLTHAERIAELEEILANDDIPTLYYKDSKNIKAAIEYHKGFKDQNELCEPSLLKFSDGKIDLENFSDPHAWYEVLTKASSIQGLRKQLVQYPPQPRNVSAPEVRRNAPDVTGTADSTVFRWNTQENMNEINIEFCVEAGNGGTGGRIRTTAFHDTGSNLLSVFESELNFLLHNGANNPVIQQSDETTPTGLIQSRQFPVQVRLLTADNSRVLRDWHVTRAMIVSDHFRLASTDTLMQQDFFLTFHRTNRGLYVTKNKTRLVNLLPP